MKDWEIIADNWVKPVGVGAVSQRLISQYFMNPTL